MVLLIILNGLPFANISKSNKRQFLKFTRASQKLIMWPTKFISGWTFYLADYFLMNWHPLSLSIVEPVYNAIFRYSSISHNGYSSARLVPSLYKQGLIFFGIAISFIKLVFSPKLNILSVIFKSNTCLHEFHIFKENKSLNLNVKLF